MGQVQLEASDSQHCANADTKHDGALSSSFRRDEHCVNNIEQHIAVERLAQEPDPIGERVLSFFAPSSV
jgi:hypothetical protein